MVVPGEASGVLVEAESLEPSVLKEYAGRDVVMLLRRAEGDEEVTAAGRNLRAIVLLQELPHLSHLGVRARQEQVPLVTTTMEGNEKAVRALLGQTVTVTAGASGGVRIAAGGTARSATAAPKAGAGAAAAAPAAPGAAKTNKAAAQGGKLVVPLAGVDAATAGAKAATCGELAALASRMPSFKAPSGVVLPFGAMDAVAAAAGKAAELSQLVSALESADGAKLDAACARVTALVKALAGSVPAAVVSEVAKAFPSGARLAVRSSSNVEDLKGMSGAGLYDSIVGVDSASAKDVPAAVADVWASLYTRRAVLARRAAGVKQSDAAMAILVQELVPAELSFVLHTAAPGSADPSVVLAEVAVGLGETLASGTRGSGWRIEARPGAADSIKVLSFANFSSALVRGPDGAVRSEPVSYAKQWFSTDVQRRNALAARLASIGKELEKALGCPQDVEGAVVGDEVVIVQSRPQPL